MRLLLLLACLVALTGEAADRPNIVWIVGEDLGPELGCYGDAQARTPHIDNFAREAVRFTHAFTHAPVCAPSRSGLITGRYPTSIGTHHMRSELLKPPPTFTSYLRAAGYFVAWPGKTDFNFPVPKEAFDSTKPWTNDLPCQPFFAYVNLGVTHESQIRAPAAALAKNIARLTPGDRHDPAKMVLPPYYPDTPETRRDLVNYYDLVTALDYQVGDILTVLEKAGVSTNTLLLFFGDHGRGLPRSKRWVYDSGIHVPLLVRWPGKLRGGSVRDDLVSFIDFAPSILAAAGVKVEMQGFDFLSRSTTPRKYIFAARDRMDETPDRIRAVRSKDFKYIRNFHPDLPYAQRIQYMELMPTMQVWRELNAAGKLTGAQKIFFQPTKPPEEFYDLRSDPFEVNNLAEVPRHRKRVEHFRGILERWMKETGDLGNIQEAELIQRGLVADKLKEYESRIEPGKSTPK